ncbi:protease modulator HflC [Isoalcanivorax beigongshangi]|uniref:Protein HflC n=1 Tax=Isoalcanivorax beigongshangi TaxID=3238810 RepID=A0ABV4ADS3_9GAMM
MSGKSLASLIAVIFLGVLALDSYYIVTATERAVLKRFQQIVQTDIQPDIHFKVPFVDQVVRVDARYTAYELPPQSYLTSERKPMDVSSFVIWRVQDVQRYVTVIGGGAANNSERMREIAQQRLNVRVAERLRNEFAQKTVQEVVAGRKEVLADGVRPDLVVPEVGDGSGDAPPPPVIRAEDAGELKPSEDARELLMVNVVQDLKDELLEDFGIELIDIRVKQVDWPDEVRSRVFDRMRAERARDAARHRSEGREGAEKIRAAAERERTVLLAEAYRDSELIRGDGDAESAAIYARMYNQDREFFSFYRSLQAYRHSFGEGKDLMVLAPDGEFFRYLKSPTGK